MARWLIIRNDDGVTLFYDNLITGMRHPCGSTGSDVPDAMVLSWIFNEAAPAFWDRIHLSDGRMLVFQRSEAMT